MQKIRVLIAEDDWIISKEISYSLEDLGFQVVGATETGEEALQLLSSLKPDIVLLDIDLAGELTGIETAAEMKKVSNIPYIFLTALSDIETVHKAKITNPLAYLVKPVKPESLLSAIEISLYNAHSKGGEIPDGPSTRLPIDGSIFVKTRRRLEKIKIKDIIWLQADDIYATVVTPVNQFILSQSLKTIEDRLPTGFLRIHRSYIIQIDKIDAIEDGDVIINARRIPIGKTYREKLMQAIATF